VHGLRDLDRPPVLAVRRGLAVRGELSPMARPEIPDASASSSIVSRRLCRNARSSRPNGAVIPTPAPTAR
jgi:hypothetical protein